MEKIAHSEGPSFSISQFRLTLAPREKIRLPRANKGITLRGAFGMAFRSLVCVDLNARCDKCTMHSSCPYGFIFAPRVPEKAERLRLNRDIPRPFVIKPPVDGLETYNPGNELSFGLVLVGRSADFLPYFIVTLRELGERGMGIGRGRFDLKKLEARKADDTWEELYAHQENLVRAPSALLTFDSMRSNSPGRTVRRVRLRFLTPVQIKEKDRWVKPDFGPLIKRLRDRANALSYFYCNETLDLDFRALGEKAEKIPTAAENLRWVEENRYSRHRDLRHLLKGYLGEVEFEGDLGPFMPRLGLGEFIHVGKATAFGQGWYEMDVIG